jgi:hypothetical protein
VVVHIKCFSFDSDRGGDKMMYCQKMKRRQRVHRISIGMKRDTVRWHSNVNQRRGDTGEEKGRRRRHLD